MVCLCPRARGRELVIGALPAEPSAGANDADKSHLSPRKTKFTNMDIAYRERERER